MEEVIDWTEVEKFQNAFITPIGVKSHCILYEEQLHVIKEYIT